VTILLRSGDYSEDIVPDNLDGLLALKRLSNPFGKVFSQAADYPSPRRLSTLACPKQAQYTVKYFTIGTFGGLFQRTTHVIVLLNQSIIVMHSEKANPS
jgi:hypothetical protein